MNKRKLTLNVGAIEDVAVEFTKVWHRVEAGKSPKNAPIEKITFSSERQLFKVMTPKRCDLLKYVHKHGKISIRALAKELERDYSNVHQDVQNLYRIGLILKDKKDNKYYVPWHTIVTEISMTQTPAANEANETSSHAHHRSSSSRATHR